LNRTNQLVVVTKAASGGGAEYMLLTEVIDNFYERVGRKPEINGKKNQFNFPEKSSDHQDRANVSAAL
jgi:truncated hemoglobin YjbI